jgi:polar amino acid transport system ATP-binding protein
MARIKIGKPQQGFRYQQINRPCDQERDIGSERWRIVVIIGPSGSGKSTLLRSVNKLEIPTSGKIFVDDDEVTAPNVDIRKIREEVGMVFQSFNLFPHLS